MSTALITTNSGGASGDYRYYAYGRYRGGGELPTEQNFTSQKLDASGLIYYNSRYYDPELGAFLSPDTLVPDPTNLFDYNRLMYVRGNPLRFNDPSGHQTSCVANSSGSWDCNGATTGGQTLDINLSDEPKSKNPDQTGFLTTMGTLFVGSYLAAFLAPYIPALLPAAAEGACADSDCTDEVKDVVKTLPCTNSFSPDTVVLTADGLEPITTLTIGDQVYAYNEETGQTGLYTVTATMAHLDPVIVILVIDDETIHTTPAHPFYVNGKWVDAGKLHVGDPIRKKDGSVGHVDRVMIARHSQMMYNLTVDQAHTFFVGHEQWLVHNAGPCVSFQKLAGFSQDVLTKGYHLNSDVGEISLTPSRLTNGTIQLSVGPAGSTTSSITNKIVQGVSDLLSKDPNGALTRARAIISNFGNDPKYANRVAQAQLIIEALTSGNYTVTK